MADSSPTLSRRHLSRILGLSDDASLQQIQAAMPRLLTRLRHRLSAAEGSEAEALHREIEALESSRAHFVSTSDANPSVDKRVGRQRLLGALLGSALTLALLMAYAAGFRVTRLEEEDIGALLADPAQLVLDGRLPGATLRVFDSDREELLLKIPAAGARVELAAGRYALDVHREDCPDHWTRSFFFEEGATHRFEPQICLGEAPLTIRSNVKDDRLRIDGLDLGPTREKPHLVGVGDHEVRVEKRGYTPFLATVRVRPNDPLTLFAELIADSTANPAVGRPIPVEKILPVNPPLTTLHPESLAPAKLFEDFTPSVSDLVFVRRVLLESDDPSHILSGGGSTRWHDRVSADLLTRFDLDASGQIDRLEESEAIPCRVWREIEEDFDGGGLGLSMVRYYGFDGSEWHPNALGFAEAHRSAVFAKMKECGLQS